VRSELPSPLAARYDGWGQMSSSREKNKHKKQTPKHKSKNKQQYQAMSQGFYDQPRQQDYDLDWRLSQPPPKKIRKTDDRDVRGESALQTFPFSFAGGEIEQASEHAGERSKSLISTFCTVWD